MQRNSEWEVIVVGGINTDYLVIGGRTAIVGRVGPGLSGEAMIEALRGVDTRYVMRDEHAETGAAVPKLGARVSLPRPEGVQAMLAKITA